MENWESFKGLGYSTAEIQQLVSMGVASGYMAVLVLGFYVSSREVAILYANPELLWLLCPALLYWINRAWLIGHRGLMNDDPVVFCPERPKKLLDWDPSRHCDVPVEIRPPLPPILKGL